MSTPDAAKSRLRRQLLAARQAVPRAVRDAEAEALAAGLATALATDALPGLPGSVCAYWPVGSEPGSPTLWHSLLTLGCRMLLPVVTAVGPLDWAEYSPATSATSLRSGPLGLREPTGPLLGCAAIGEAVLVLVPALAVDRRGVRLGRGGGHYDRTLRLVRPGIPVVAVVRDEEMLDSLPTEPHDVPVSAALTPGQGLFRLPRHGPARGI